jgi:hypothetical protein
MPKGHSGSATNGCLRVHQGSGPEGLRQDHAPGRSGGGVHHRGRVRPIDSQEFAATLAALHQQDDAASARATVASLTAKLEDLAEAWANDSITKQEWDAARAPLAARLEAAERSCRGHEHHQGGGRDAFGGHPGALRAAWADLPHDRRRDIVATLLRSVTIPPNLTPGNNRFQPELLVPDWRH